jgi:hypothetical protein
MRRATAQACRAAAIGVWVAFVAPAASAAPADGRTFSQDVDFLRTHTATLVLSAGESRIAVCPAYQGRVMTSTAGGSNDLSFGWLNDAVIANGVDPDGAPRGSLEAHIHVFGGEERFWLGPEGGQYGLFFAPDAEYRFEDWHTPAALDTEPFEVTSSNAASATFAREFSLVNNAGTEFHVAVERSVRVLDRASALRLLGVTVSNAVDVVAYESANRITNRGPDQWVRDTGVLSIWLLGMYKPGPRTTVVIPFVPGEDDDLGPIVDDAYFGVPPEERLAVTNGVLCFSADGTYRSKIGVRPKRAKGVAGSYDPDRGVLTVVRYLPRPANLLYVNSMWELQDEPYSGDVINAYNDGPPTPGAKPLGPFYELETSSPGAELEEGQTLTHTQQTFHLVGEEALLDPVARTVFGVPLAAINAALPDPM